MCDPTQLAATKFRVQSYRLAAYSENALFGIQTPKRY